MLLALVPVHQTKRMKQHSLVVLLCITYLFCARYYDGRCVLFMFFVFIYIQYIMSPVVQRMDSVTEGLQSYGGKINAVETDLKKMGKSPLAEHDIK